MVSLRALSFLALCTVALAGCAANPVHQRGWVGGDVLEVSRCAGWFGTSEPWIHADGVVGMPEGVGQDEGLLLVEVPPATPLGRAGLQAGDLLLAAGDAELRSAEDLWEAAEAAGPGQDLSLTLWRHGEQRDVVVPVGEESYRKYGRLSIALGFHFELDLWPFDDGIDILGLVVIGSDSRRLQKSGVRADYVRSLAPGEPVRMASQEVFTFRIVPLGIGSHVEVLEQRAEADPSRAD